MIAVLLLPPQILSITTGELLPGNGIYCWAAVNVPG